MTPLDKVLAVLEPYAEGRVVERDLRRKMVALRCSRIGETDDTTARCYLANDDPAGYCPACAERSRLWLLFKSRREANKALLRRVEELTLRLSMPEEAERAEPGPLLEMMS